MEKTTGGEFHKHNFFSVIGPTNNVFKIPYKILKSNYTIQWETCNYDILKVWRMVRLTAKILYFHYLRIRIEDPPNWLCNILAIDSFRWGAVIFPHLFTDRKSPKVILLNDFAPQKSAFFLFGVSVTKSLDKPRIFKYGFPLDFLS